MAPSTRKRKRSPSPPPSPPSSPPPPAQTLTVFATQLKQNLGQPSLLLDLPAELRNTIYTMVLEDTEVLLSRNTTKKALAVGCALPRVNKQVRDEFMAVALLSADIRTTAMDFDFRHIVTFLNRLSDAELKALPSVTVPSQRRITVDLIISDRCPVRPPYFQRWINRAGHPTKKGTNINLQYNLASGRTHHTGPPWVAGGQTPRFAAWKPLFKRLKEGREKEELGKITAALGY